MESTVALCWAMAAIQIAIWAVLAAGLRKVASSPPRQVNDRPLFVSVVVAAKDEFNNLQSLIPTLLRQDYPHFEIVVALDRPTDGSQALLEHWAAQDPRVRFVSVENLPPGWDGKKFALTQGIHAAQGEILLLTDADCLPASPQWIALMTAAYGPETAMVLGIGAYKPRTGLLNQAIQFETAYTAFQYVGMAAIGNPYMAVGRNLSFRKSFFLEKNGYGKFADRIGGDDDLFVNTHGSHAKITAQPDRNAHTLSIPKNSWKQWWKQKKRHLGAGTAYRWQDQLWIGTLNATHLLFYLFALVSLAQFNALPIIFVYICRQMALFALFWLGARATCLQGNKMILLPFMDICYTLYYLATGFAALFIKSRKWS
jgi:glycosyltransferase involved in cell wall biosynthesis